MGRADFFGSAHTCFIHFFTATMPFKHFKQYNISIRHFQGIVIR